MLASPTLALAWCIYSGREDRLVKVVFPRLRLYLSILHTLYFIHVYTRYSQSPIPTQIQVLCPLRFLREPPPSYGPLSTTAHAWSLMTMPLMLNPAATLTHASGSLRPQPMVTGPQGPFINWPDFGDNSPLQLVCVVPCPFYVFCLAAALLSASGVLRGRIGKPRSTVAYCPYLPPQGDLHEP